MASVKASREAKNRASTDEVSAPVGDLARHLDRGPEILYLLNSWPA